MCVNPMCLIQMTVVVEAVEPGNKKSQRIIKAKLPVPNSRTKLSIDIWVSPQEPGPQPGEAMSLWGIVGCTGGSETPMRLWQKQCDVYGFTGMGKGEHEPGQN